MIFAYDDWVQLPTKDLYDSDIMKMAIMTAKDMYDKGQDRLDKFYKEYGDFMSPFSKDMARYGEMIGGVRNMINDAYAHGVDLLRTPEGRAMISQAINKINPAELNMMRSNAKAGYAYLDAMQKLRSEGKYSEAQELFDIAFNKGTQFNDFATAGENGGFNIWDRTSPIQATSLLDLTYDSYKNRTPRDLTVADFTESNGLNKGMFDPKYQYTGYLDSDLMKVAPGAAMSIAADPRAAYFRDLAEKKVAARGGNYTQADVDAQFYRDIADANKWALVDPTKKADEFALDDYRTANDIRAHKANAAVDHYYKTLENGGGNGGDKTQTGYSMANDLYITSLAKSSGNEYLHQGGVTMDDLSSWLKDATKIQKKNILEKGDVLSATGMWVSPEKISGLIQSDGKNGRGHFLNTAYLKNLHDPEDIRSSYKGWTQRGKTAQESAQLREEKKQLTNATLSSIREFNNSSNGQYRLKVVPYTDDNGNNIYGIVGEDNRWHTYARVKVYMSDGAKKTKKSGEGKHAIPEKGKDMLLEIGLHSNRGTASPDLSVSAREEYGPYDFKSVKSLIGTTGNAAWPWGTNIISDTRQ